MLTANVGVLLRVLLVVLLVKVLAHLVQSFFFSDGADVANLFLLRAFGLRNALFVV